MNNQLRNRSIQILCLVILVFISTSAGAQRLILLTGDDSAQVELWPFNNKAKRINLSGDNLELELERKELYQLRITLNGYKEIRDFVMGDQRGVIRHDIHRNKWKVRNDTADKQLYFSGLYFKHQKFSSLNKSFIYSDDSAKFNKRKAKAIYTYLKPEKGKLTNQLEPFDPYIFERDGRYLEIDEQFPLSYTSNDLFDLNQVFINQGFLDTNNFIFPDFNNILFIGAYIKSWQEYSINNDDTYLSQVDAEALWFIENAYGEVLDTFTIQASSAIHQGRDRYNSSSFDPYTDLLNNMSVKFFDHPILKKHLSLDRRKENSESIVAIPLPSSPSKEKKHLAKSTVRIKNHKRAATGFAISEDGLILTTYSNIATHKMNSPEELYVETADGSSLAAKVIRISKADNLALLKVEHKFENPILLPDSNYSVTFKDIYACSYSDNPGIPLNLYTGIISGYRTIENHEILQVNISFDRGNVGSPIMDDDGNLQGLAIRHFMGHNQEGVGFAFPAYLILESLNLKY